MKRWIMRLRHRLIRNLGGYVEPPAFPVKQTGMEVVTLKYSTKVHIYDQGDEARVIAKSRLAREMGRKMLESGMIEFSEADPITWDDEPVLRARAFLLRPEDARRMKL